MHTKRRAPYVTDGVNAFSDEPFEWGPPALHGHHGASPDLLVELRRPLQRLPDPVFRRRCGLLLLGYLPDSAFRIDQDTAFVHHRVALCTSV